MTQAARRNPEARGLFVRRVLFGWFLVSSAAACEGARSVELLGGSLDDGRPLQALVRFGRPNAILIYDAATCFTCGTAIPQWRRLMTDARVHVAVVLAGAVTDADLRALRIQRIPIAGTMKKPPFGPSSMPVELLTADHGQIHAIAIGAEAVHARRLWAHLVPLLGEPTPARSGSAQIARGVRATLP